MYAYLAIIVPILTIAQTPPEGRCPGLYQGTPPDQEAPIPTLEAYNAALQELSIPNIFTDLFALNLNSQDCWPADQYPTGASYGPLFVRLAWHCSGTFRDTDVPAGGCAGGRQRFPPEASWDDNTNLDKARALLYPIKQKYGIGLSWGDLMVFAGTAAILQGGGPVTQICAGRIDEGNGASSVDLGPTPEQQECCPCPVQGNCPEPLGADTIGLIYVNPEGFMGNADDPLRTAQQIREVFGRMNMNDRETVALIGGGHAFGKCHGACERDDAAGQPPVVNPLNPWNGSCSIDSNSPIGKGTNTFSSGFEGAWTSNPTRWTNEFFVRLQNEEYIQTKSPGGKTQWVDPQTNLIMLTSDVALWYDSSYRAIVQSFASDIGELNEAFSNAWEKLVTDGGGFAENKFCIQPNFKIGNSTNTAYKKRKH